MISTLTTDRRQYTSLLRAACDLPFSRRQLRSFSAILPLFIGLGAGTAAAQTYSLDFSNSDLGMFDLTGSGSGTGSLASFRLESDIPQGVANINVGGVVNTLFAGRYGAEAGLGLHGTVGVDFNFSYHDGTLGISFPQDVTFNMGTVNAANPNVINISNMLTGSNIITASTPSVAWDVQGNIDLALGAHARACFGGCVSASHDILNFNESFTLLDFNQNRDDRLRLFGSDTLSVEAENGITIPISRNLFLSKEKKITKAGINGSDKAFYNITLGTIELNQLNLSYQNRDANGFAVGGANAPDAPIAGLYADVFGIAAAAAGLPFNPLDIRVGAGPLSIQGKLFQLLAGGKFGLEQEFSFDPNMMVTFHSNYDVAWSGGDGGAFVGQQYSLSLDKEGGLNDINFDLLHEGDAAGLAIVPEVYLQNPSLTNHTAMTFGPSVLAQALELNLTVAGIGLRLGPAFAEELIPSDIKTDIDLINDTINIGNQAGLSTRYFMPSLTGVGGGPKELTEYANVDVARGSLVFETPIIGGSVTLRDETLYRNASPVTINGRLELVGATPGAPNLYFGDGIESLDGIIRVGANSILDATGSHQDIAHGGSPSSVGQGTAQSNFIGADKVLRTGILDIGGEMYYNGHAIETIDSAAGLVIHGEGRIHANSSDALANLASNHGVLSIQNLGSVDTGQSFANHGLMSVIGSEEDWGSGITQRSTFRSNGYTNHGILEIGGGGQVDTTGVSGTSAFGNVDASGTLTGGPFLFSGGQLIYNGPMITTNETTLLFTGLRESDSSFVHRSGNAGSFIDTNGLAELHTNKGSLILQATDTASTEITFDSLTNTADGHILLNVTNEFESSSGSSHLYVTNGFTNHGLLELTDNVKGTLDTNINQVTSGWFWNNGTLRIDPRSTFNAGDLSNIDYNGRLSGGDWHIAGRFIYEGGNENMLRSIAQDTTLALGNGAEFKSRNAGDSSLAQLEHIQGTLIIADDKHTIGHMLINDGSLILSGLLDGTGHANDTVLITGSLLNRGSVFLNSGAKLSVAGNLNDYELQNPDQVAEHRQDEVLVHADGQLRNLGDVTLDGHAQLLYGGYDITTIGTGTKLTFSGTAPNPRVLRLTMAGNNLDSYNAHDALRGLDAITGELHLTNGARFGDNLDQSNELTVANGGTLTVDAESQLNVRDGSTLHVASGATLLNNGLLQLRGTSNDATLNFTGSGTGPFVLTGTSDFDDAAHDVTAPSGVITLGSASVALSSENEDELDFTVTRQWTGSGAITTNPTGDLINQDQLIIGTGVIDTGTLTNHGIIHAEGDTGLSIIARRNFITNAGIFHAASGTPDNGQGMMLSGFDGNRLSFYNSENFGSELGPHGHIEVERNLSVDDAEILGGSIHVAETGRFSLMNAALFHTDMTSDGQVVIEGSGIHVHGKIELNPASSTFVSGGANLHIEPDTIVTHSGRMHLADGASVGGPGDLNNSGIIQIDGGTAELAARFSNRIHMIFDSENLIVPAQVNVVNGGSLRLNNTGGEIANFGQINVGAEGGRIDIAQPGDPVEGHTGTLTLARDTRLVRPVSGYDEEHAENVLEDDGAFGLIQLGGAVHVAGDSVASGWDGHGVITGQLGSDYLLTNVANTIRGQGNIGAGMLRLNNANNGTIEAPAHAHLVIQPSAGGFTNEGTVRAMADGEVEIIGNFNNFSAANAALNNGTYDVAGTLRFDGARVQVLGANVTLRGSGQIVDQHGTDALTELNTITADGSLTVKDTIYEHTGSLTNHGALILSEDASFLITGSYNQTGGTSTINGTFAASDGITVSSGALTGSGTFGGNLTNAGILSPGNSPGITTVQGDYIHEFGATLSIEIGGLALGIAYDQLAVDGDITLLGGTLEILPWNDFMPENGDSFTILSFTSLSGTFDTIDAFSLGDGQFWDFNNLYSSGTINVIPEPSTVAFIVGSLALGLVIVRRKHEKRANSTNV